MAVAFAQQTINNMQTNIRELYYRRLKVGKLFFTHAEYIQTFVPAEARDAFWTAANWCAPDNRMHRWELQVDGAKINTTLQMHLAAGKACPPPVARMLQIQGDAPPELVERIHYWANRGGDASREFGRVMKLLDIMNLNFSRVAIRYYWPTILAICSESPKTSDLAREMQDMKMPARLKALPPGVMAACKLTAETISSARLISADIEDTENGEVEIGIVAGQQYNESFGNFWGLN